MAGGVSRPNPGTLIVALNVRPDSWRTGVGHSLCEFALREAPRRQWEVVTVWVLDGNWRACRFYEALGFALDGADRIETGLIGAPIHEFLYEKIVNG